jgi:hypothetical protein
LAAAASSSSTRPKRCSSSTTPLAPEGLPRQADEAAMRVQRPAHRQGGGDDWLLTPDLKPCEDIRL